MNKSEGNCHLKIDLESFVGDVYVQNNRPSMYIKPISTIGLHLRNSGWQHAAPSQ